MLLSMGMVVLGKSKHGPSRYRKVMLLEVMAIIQPVSIGA